MKLFLKSQLAKLQANQAAQNGSKDFKPVVKLFTPWGGATWLLSEMDQGGIAFGLCDLGNGSPELGYVDINELTSVRGPFGLKVERDRHFEATKSCSEYASEASAAGSIVA
jgi:hypothetical protein